MAGLELENMYADECPHCLSASLDEFLQTGYACAANANLLQGVLAEVRAGGLDSVQDRLFELYNTNLQKAVRRVFNEKDADHRSLDYLYKFDANAARFAAYKAHYVTNTLQKAWAQSPQNFDENGKRLLSTFNRFQATEHNTTVARCRTAKQMMQFLEDKDLYPNLEWLMTRSVSPREGHLALVGLILPIEHPFWRKNQPGNLYNCKCDWKQSNKPATDDPTITVTPAKGLEGNPCTTREIYTDNHPYIAHAKDAEAVESFVEKHVFQQFEAMGQYKNGGKYLVHPLVEKQKEDYTDLVSIARQFAGLGKTTYIMPNIHKDSKLYNYYFAHQGAYAKKCPDLLVDGTFFEYESFTPPYGQRTLENMLTHATRQSDKIIIDIRNISSTMLTIRKHIGNRIRMGQIITEVWVLKDGNILERML